MANLARPEVIKVSHKAKMIEKKAFEEGGRALEAKKRASKVERAHAKAVVEAHLKKVLMRTKEVMLEEKVKVANTRAKAPRRR